jgi:hypothetical protein
MPQESTSIASGPSYLAQSSEPTDTSVMWVDTSDDSRVKYHDGSSWVSVNATADEAGYAGGYVSSSPSESLDWWDDSTSTSVTLFPSSIEQITFGRDDGTGDTFYDSVDYPIWCDGVELVCEWSVSGDHFNLYVDTADGFSKIGDNVGDGEVGSPYTFSTTFSLRKVTGFRCVCNNVGGSFQWYNISPQKVDVGGHSHE